MAWRFLARGRGGELWLTGGDAGRPRDVGCMSRMDSVPKLPHIAAVQGEPQAKRAKAGGFLDSDGAA